MRDTYFWESCYVLRVRPARPKGTLLYIHGLGESGICFDTLVARPELREWEHLVPDLPGYGRSLWKSRPQGVEDLAEWVTRFFPSQGVEKPVLLGHSMGGVIGQLVAENAPELLRGFVNVEGNLTLEDCSFSGPSAACSLDEFLESGFDQLRDKVYREGELHPPMKGYYASLRFADPVQFHLNSRDLVQVSRRGDLARRFARLEIPRLYFAGLDGGIGPTSRRLLQGEGAPWVGVQGGGHWPYLQQQDSVVSHLAQYLAGLA